MDEDLTGFVTNEFSPLVVGILQKLQNPGDGLQRLVDRAHATFMAQFQSAGAYLGESWAPLAESTLRRKPGASAEILVDTETLRRSLTERDAPHGIVEMVDVDTIGVGTDLNYALFHQVGTKKMPARPLVVQGQGLLDGSQASGEGGGGADEAEDLGRWLVEETASGLEDLGEGLEALL